ncbi:Pycsar system effector family protein [Streptomyces sp. NPDC004539]|uniref:Pycsar system effector family protein n=1 Tax=Streptomyces sp. NPDC004539 TaxID=3154280 RepID=UPI0033A59FC5
MTATDPAPFRPPAHTGSRERIRLCERLLADLHTEIARADNKAAVLVAALGVTAGLCTGLLAGRNWTPAALSAPGTTLWWSGTGFLVGSLFALLLAVLPRYRTRSWAPGLPLTYFGDIRQAVRHDRLEPALADTERDPVAALTAALAESSRIAARKHQWIRIGLTSFCLGTVLLPASLLIG